MVCLHNYSFNLLLYYKMNIALHRVKYNFMDIENKNSFAFNHGMFT